jgi:aryl-alcohol dehydrogenase-like predicted oxidoreductase
MYKSDDALRALYASQHTPQDFRQPRPLGRSGLEVSRLGFGASHNAPARAYERAFELGCNYFYWGTARRPGMGEAIRALAPQHREEMVIALQSYSRFGTLLRCTFLRGLKKLKLDYADVLLLGWHNKLPSLTVLEAALRLKEEGLARAIAISCHHRPSFAQYITDPRFDIVMVRYNAAHRGAEREVFPHLDRRETRPGVISYTATRWGTLIDPKLTPPEHKTPTAADCYRFALSNPHVDLCLSDPKTELEMEENLRALELGPMSTEELLWMRAVGDHVIEQLRGKPQLVPFRGAQK